MTRSDFEATPYQYTLVSSAQTYLTNNKVVFNEVEVKCDCGTIIQLPVPKSKFDIEMANVDVNQSLIDGHLDYLFTSKLSIPSINQPGHRGCIYMGILK